MDNDKLCDLCCCEGTLEKTHGMIICETCMEEIACIDNENRIWRWTSGQDGDVCVKCKKDLSDPDMSILMNTESPYVLVACESCIDALSEAVAGESQPEGGGEGNEESIE